MDASLNSLADALRERLTLIADEASRRDPERHMQRLAEISGKLDQLERSLPSSIDPQLRHFLQRRSYSKALEMLESTEV